jgi:hypothetical protein
VAVGKDGEVLVARERREAVGPRADVERRVGLTLALTEPHATPIERRIRQIEKSRYKE